MRIKCGIAPDATPNPAGGGVQAIDRHAALVEAVLVHYEKFEEELRADLPLKRIWTVVQEG